MINVRLQNTNVYNEMYMENGNKEDHYETETMVMANKYRYYA